MKYTYLFLAALVSGILLWANIELYSPELSADERQEDIVLQLNFLEEQLKEKKLGRRMQSIFPEGYVFIYSLYGLAWAELAQGDLSGKPDLQIRAAKEAAYAYEAVDSDKGRLGFPKSLSPEHGIYYSGWRNYLLAKTLSIPEDFSGKTDYSQVFQARCQQIAEAFSKQESPYLSSYPDQSWPADSFLAIASLAIHDKLYGPVYKREIDSWLQKVKEHLDSKTGMLAHKTDPDSGDMIEKPRGGSMALMLRLLAEIDQPFAKEQYALFKQNFISTALGLPNVREYPKGTFGIGDIDSGPVVLGTSFAGTIVSIGTFSVFGDIEMADRQYRTVTAFGLERKSEDEKSYLLGMLPMADAFIAWSRTAPVLISSYNSDDLSSFWKLRFHCISLLIPAFLIALYYRKALIAQAKQRFTKHK